MTLRVSLAPTMPPRPAVLPAVDAAPKPLLDVGGARVIIGGGVPDALATPIAPTVSSLFGPRGVYLGDFLAVCDTGHHRLLIWSRTPDADNTPADLVIGQPDFTSEGRNARGAIGPATLNVPTGIAFGDGVLAVADAWNHRVLLWRGAPSRSNQPADIVLGHADFVAGLANRGLDAPRADTLNWCYGVAIAAGRLFVADTGNRRVLVWNRIPDRSGAPADLVLGQSDFTCRDESGGGNARAGLRWPHAIVATTRHLFVADAGSSRLMAWNGLPRDNGRPSDFLLGQHRFEQGDHNGGFYFPTAAVMNMPYGMTMLRDRLVVADTANSRLIGFESDAVEQGSAASYLAGQHAFADKGDNRWQSAARDSLCWPYGIAACGTTLAIADSGNNRVMLWDAA